jgi:tRNA threonylcarbamoyladenosine biosynthesis protein TsaB
MLVLALDTTTRAGSCGLMRDGALVGERPGDPEVSAAERLPIELMTLLEECGVTLADVDIFAVATGPGSFTSLRVGIATMQGLAFAQAKPLIGVSGLDALAAVAAGGDGALATARVATWVEAWRGDVYAALYEDGRQIDPPTVSAPAALLARLANVSNDPNDPSVSNAPNISNDPILFIGDGAARHHDMIAAAMGPRAQFAPQVAPPIAAVVAMLATRAAHAGARPGPGEIRPLYVQRTEVTQTTDARPVS